MLAVGAVVGGAVAGVEAVAVVGHVAGSGVAGAWPGGLGSRAGVHAEEQGEVCPGPQLVHAGV